MDSDCDSPPESLYETADDIDEEYVPDGQDDAAESSAIADAQTVGDFEYVPPPRTTLPNDTHLGHFPKSLHYSNAARRRQG